LSKNELNPSQSRSNAAAFAIAVLTNNNATNEEAAKDKAIT
jgi:hypothetical protein